MRRRIVLSGLGLAAFYWIIETVADSVFGGEGPVVTRLLPADANEVWMRLIIVALILAFASYAATTVERRARTDRKLRLLESAVEHTDDAVLMTTAELDPPGPEIIYVNEAFCRQTGHAAEELLGHTPRMLQGPDSEREVMDRLRRCLELSQHFVGSITNYRKDGSSFRVELRISPVYSTAGKLTHWISVQHDVTEQERAEAALRESEERYRAVVEQAADGLYLADVQTLRIVGTNPSIRKMLGYSVEELQAMEAHDLVGLSREEVASSLQRTLEGGQSLLGERKYRRKDGTFIDVEVSASGITYGGRQTACVVIHDVTERKRAEIALGEVREAERSQIARDLHDEVLQDLMDALYSMQVTHLKLVGDEEIDLSEIEEQILDLRKATQGLREAITNLRRGGVQSQPFLHLLRSVVAETRQKAPGTEVALDVDASLASVNSPAGNSGIELLRIVQEALVNARRHSGARYIWVSLWVEGRYVIAEVVDDGRGFDAETSWGGVGLFSMQERALKLGGSLDIQSEPGKGARVTVRIPDAASNFAADALHPPRVPGAADGG